jgi:hypothetical protein
MCPLPRRSALAPLSAGLTSASVRDRSVLPPAVGARRMSLHLTKRQLRLGGRNWFLCSNFGPFPVRSQGVRGARFSPEFTIVCRLIQMKAANCGLKTQFGREACSTPRRIGVRPEGARGCRRPDDVPGVRSFVGVLDAIRVPATPPMRRRWTRGQLPNSLPSSPKHWPLHRTSRVPCRPPPGPGTRL